MAKLSSKNLLWLLALGAFILSACQTPQYSVQVKNHPGSKDGGTITFSQESANGMYSEGTVLTLTAAPNSGFDFDGWRVDGTGDVITWDNPTTLTVTQDTVFVCRFEEQMMMEEEQEPEQEQEQEQ